MKFLYKNVFILILLILTNTSSEAKNFNYCSSNPIWKHAAYKGSEETYSKNIESAIRSGYCGIELDVIYDEDKNLVYISRGQVYSSKEKNFLSLNSLDEIIKDQDVYIWLDWKNSKLSNIAKTNKLIQNSMKKYLSNKKSMIFIETPNIVHNELLNLLNKNQNISILNWISHSSDKNNLIEKIKNIYRFIRAWTYICILPDRRVSSHDIEILEICKNNRKSKSIFIFTINSLDEAKRVFVMGGDVVLSDTITNIYEN